MLRVSRMSSPVTPSRPFRPSLMVRANAELALVPTPAPAPASAGGPPEAHDDHEREDRHTSIPPSATMRVSREPLPHAIIRRLGN